MAEKYGKKTEFRKVDQILKFTNDQGKEKIVNTSCMDMDKQMAAFFGVSSAVLENVIFCHQEETLWPFSDQGHLKKIFDEIFETEKYTRILQDMRQEIKNFRSSKKVTKGEHDLRAKDFAVYKKIIKALEECKEKMNALQATSKNIKAEMEVSDKRLGEYAIKEEQLKSVENELQLQRYQIHELRVQADKLNSNPNYKSISKTKEELIEMLSSLENTSMEGKKAAIEEEQRGVKLRVVKLEEELIELRTKKSSIEEIVRQESALVLC